MQRYEFIVKKETKLASAIREQLPFFSNYQIEKILKNKDVKVNDKRVTDDCNLKLDDSVVIFYEIKDKNWYQTIFEDENVVIINKKSGIEVISEDDRDILGILRVEKGEIFPIHRIDRNTEGLVIFAKTTKAEQELLTAFQKRLLTKKYLLECVGKVDVEKIKPRLFLKKLLNISRVIISEVKTSGYEEIKTKFKFIKYNGQNTLLEAELITGKTHQIRSHIAYYGHYIVGDGKYGKGNGKLHLTSYLMKFNLPETYMLSYLNTMHFEIYPSWI